MGWNDAVDRDVAYATEMMSRQPEQSSSDALETTYSINQQFCIVIIVEHTSKRLEGAPEMSSLAQLKKQQAGLEGELPEKHRAFPLWLLYRA